MKVAICTYGLMVGGIERVIFQQARIFLELGFEVRVIQTQVSGPWKSYFQREGIEVMDILPTRWTSKYTHAKKLLSILKNVDIVFSHDSIVTMAVISALPPRVLVFPVLHSVLQSMLDNAIANMGAWQKVICVSPLLQKLLVEECQLTNELTVAIPTAVIHSQDLIKSSKRDFGKKIIFVGRLSDFEKAVLSLPAIMEEVLKQHPDASLHIFGEGPDKERLEKIIAEKKLTDHVHVMGYLPYESVNATLRNFDFLILPSYFEGQGLIYLEAMAQGVIPVVSLLPDNTDRYITHGVNGFLCQPGSIHDFSKTIADALKRTDLVQLSLLGQETVSKHFTFEVMKAAYLALVDSYLKKHHLSTRNGLLDTEILGDLPKVPMISIRPIRKFLKIFGLWK